MILNNLFSYPPCLKLLLRQQKNQCILLQSPQFRYRLREASKNLLVDSIAPA